ncbi:tetratricopeptide repeat protein [Pseudoxanthomonas suwonensis]|uniref:OmpR/PhoB-type domain-containing protein n=1 Tax=Pseudoxanthomonas suwonensis TaxID=314722 RepID=A0A0E3Z1Y6_9GAMM|nr:tetratricopeptide repeat protein [Pseudoxanthomonas suwonensis]AKC87019.1 hypothetical protein WQ53_09965 [Pseudoxanthomonas suwonensis]
MKPGTDQPPAPDGDGGSGRYRFDGIVVDAAAHTLVRDGRELALEPKAFAVLLALLRRPGELLGRDALLDQVWGHRHVTPGVLTRAIAQLRAALDDDSQHPRYIQTQHALGYRFIGRLESATSVLPALAAEAPVAVKAADAIQAAPALPAAPVAPADDPAGPQPRLQDQAPGASLLAWVAGLAAALALGAVAWLWREPGPPPVATEASIAVLPFTTLSDARDDRYFAEGLSVEMLNALAGVHGLKVAAWRPPEAIDRSQDIQALGRLLGVATLLDASVRRDGQRLRISARLSDTRSGYTLWSRSYDGDADTIFATQTDIADAVVDALVEVLPEERENLRRRLEPTRSATAFDAYLVGLRQMLHAQGDEGRNAATEHFRRALAADAGFARAQAGLCRMELWDFESKRNADAFDTARLACLRAMNMDRTMAEVSLALGDLHRVQGDEKQALKYYDAILDDPGMRWRALVGRARLHIDQGRDDQAMRDFRQALQASPGNAQVHAELGYQQYRLGRYPEAVASYRTAVALRPDVASYWRTYGGLLLTTGDTAGAEVALRRSLAIEPHESPLSNLGTLRYQEGDYAGAAELYRRAVELNPKGFFYLGRLGDALEADPRTAAQAREPYAQAALLAQRFVDVKPGDAKALAALGWYQAQLGDRDGALRRVGEARALAHEPGEVAMYNAQTLAVLGQYPQARESLQAARAAGIPESRIATHAVFRRTGLSEPPEGDTPPPAVSPAAAGPPRGE